MGVSGGRKPPASGRLSGELASPARGTGGGSRMTNKLYERR